MNNRTKGGIAAIAATTLLLGGVTFANWSQSTDVTGGQINTGLLALQGTGTKYYDVSQDRTDSEDVETNFMGITGHDIPVLSDWGMTPGDTMLGVYGIDGQLKGENMVAQLTFTNSSNDPLTHNDIIDANRGTVDYAVVDGTGTVLTDWGTLGEVKTFFASADNPRKGTLPVMGDEAGDTAYQVGVRVVFNKSTPDQEVQKAKQDVAGLKVTLTQVRMNDVPGANVGGNK